MSNPHTTRKLFIDHVAELRSRLFWILLSISTGSVIGYWYRNVFVSFLLQPLHKPVFYTSPTGGFEFLFTVCLFFGVLVSIPVILYHTVQFIQPVIPQKARVSLVRLVSLSFLLMVGGVSFAYFVSLPTALHFFNQFASVQVQSLISTNEYFSFISNYLLGFGIIFQLPLILLLTNAVVSLSLSWLVKQERLVIVFSFILGALLTPDPLNQAIMAVPLIVLYQVSILSIWLVNRKKTNAKKNR